MVVAGGYFYLQNGRTIGRTIYRGNVDIVPVNLDSLAIKLKEVCSVPFNEYGARCIFNETVHEPSGKNALEVFPRGPGFGPGSFIVTEDTLYAVKDIDGFPNIKKFKAEVRADIVLVGDVITILDDTWDLTSTDYPVNVVY